MPTKKCSFVTKTILGYVLSANGSRVYEEKVKTIREWPTPFNINDVLSFYGLVTFLPSAH